MDDEARIEGIRALLAETAHAHHEATGGPDSNWSGWYAEYLIGKFDEYLGFSPDIETISTWLTDADERHQSEEPDEKYWPTVYARYILENYTQED